MKFDFETMPDRRGKDSIAADMNENDFWPIPRGITKPGFDKIPMWIADMNFPTAPAVTEALIERIGHPVYGYFVPGDEYYDAIIRWQKQSHGVECLAQSDIGYENGVLGGVTCVRMGSLFWCIPLHTAASQRSLNEMASVLCSVL